MVKLKEGLRFFFCGFDDENDILDSISVLKCMLNSILNSRLLKGPNCPRMT